MQGKGGEARRGEAREGEGEGRVEQGRVGQGRVEYSTVQVGERSTRTRALLPEFRARCGPSRRSLRAWTEPWMDGWDGMGWDGDGGGCAGWPPSLASVLRGGEGSDREAVEAKRRGEREWLTDTRHETPLPRAKMRQAS